MTRDDVKALVQFIAKNASPKSVLLSPFPLWNVNAHAVLQEIERLTKISSATIGAWVEEARR